MYVYMYVYICVHMGCTCEEKYFIDFAKHKNSRIFRKKSSFVDKFALKKKSLQHSAHLYERLSVHPYVHLSIHPFIPTYIHN